jgi:hypothetical protein
MYSISMPAVLHNPLREARYQLAAAYFRNQPDHTPFRDMEQIIPKHRPNKAPGIGFPLANDEVAASYLEAAYRANNEIFQVTPHRVALVVGEAALVAALPYIPEESIIVADYSKNMVWYMSQYIKHLRYSRTATDWRERMAESYDGFTDAGTPFNLQEVWDAQVEDWELENVTHPFRDHREFVRVQQVAREKAIMPLHTDLGSQRSMQHLSKLLRCGRMTLTFMNHTNVLEANPLADDMLGPLHQLPFAADVPILTSACAAPHQPGKEHLGLLGAYGPFYGLDEFEAKFS